MQEWKASHLPSCRRPLLPLRSAGAPGNVGGIFFPFARSDIHLARETHNTSGGVPGNYTHSTYEAELSGKATGPDIKDGTI